MVNFDAGKKRVAIVAWFWLYTKGCFGIAVRGKQESLATYNQNVRGDASIAQAKDQKGVISYPSGWAPREFLQI